MGGATSIQIFMQCIFWFSQAMKSLCSAYCVVHRSAFMMKFTAVLSVSKAGTGLLTLGAAVKLRMEE